jgi:transposase InsO family protein
VFALFLLKENKQAVTPRSGHEPLNLKEAMRRSRTTQHETEGDMALFTFSPTVLDEDHQTVPEVRKGLAEYFHHYNFERYHQSLDYQTPFSVYRCDHQTSTL